MSGISHLLLVRCDAAIDSPSRTWICSLMLSIVSVGLTNRTEIFPSIAFTLISNLSSSKDTCINVSPTIAQSLKVCGSFRTLPWNVSFWSLGWTAACPKQQSERVIWMSSSYSAYPPPWNYTDNHGNDPRSTLQASSDMEDSNTPECATLLAGRSLHSKTMDLKHFRRWQCTFLIIDAQNQSKIDRKMTFAHASLG